MLALAACSPAVDPKAQQFYDDALARYQKHDLDGAIIQLKNALQADKSLVAARVLLGNALLAKGQTSYAEAALTDALKMGGNRADIVVPLALTWAKLGRQLDIVGDPGLSTDGLSGPVLAQLLVIKAFAHDDLGKPEKALELLEQARAADPKLTDAWLAEIPIRLRAGQLAHALAAVDQARRINPNSVEAIYQYGTILHLLGPARERAGRLRQGARARSRAMSMPASRGPGCCWT